MATVLGIFTVLAFQFTLPTKFSITVRPLCHYAATRASNLRVVTSVLNNRTPSILLPINHTQGNSSHPSTRCIAIWYVRPQESPILQHKLCGSNALYSPAVVLTRYLYLPKNKTYFSNTNQSIV
jgi:hypothetical protein